MEQLSPIPPKAMMKARRSKKLTILALLKWGGGGGGRSGPDIPFILSKIAILDSIKSSPPPPPPKQRIGNPSANRRFDRKVKCPIGRASFWVKFPTVRSLTRVKCPGIARGGWVVLKLTGAKRAITAAYCRCFTKIHHNF